MALFLKRLVVPPIAENVYIVGDDVALECVVIDPGSSAGRIAAEVRAAGMRVRYILNTHGHADHVGAVAALVKLTKAAYGIHPGDLPLIEDRSPSGLKEMIPDFLPPPKPDILLRDGDLLSVGGISIQVVATPGHTQGSACFLVTDVALTGDTLFLGSIGRFDLPGGNGEQLLESIRSKLLTLPDITRVLPGHGSASTIGQERRHNPFLREDGLQFMIR